MGSIYKRKRKDGTVAYTGQILKRRGGKVILSESFTNERRGAVADWMRKREAELSEPGGVDRALRKASGKTLGNAIETYLAETRQPMGRTKRHVLTKLAETDLAAMQCDAIRPEHIVELARSILATGVQPQTVARHLAHLQGIYTVARPGWGFELEPSVIREAMVACRLLGYAGEGKERDRRPTLDELDRLMTFFVDRSRRDPTAAPMHKVIAFAIFSTRRQDEICRITLPDLDRAGPRVMVRDMKHPGQKVGNDVWCALPEPCLAIIDAVRRVDGRLFPYTGSAISAAFTRACKLLEIPDLHFHDLRHEGISRLFEMDWQIPRVAEVSGHRSWDSLKRYTQIRQVGDKYEGWKWMPVVTGGAALRVVAG